MNEKHGCEKQYEKMHAGELLR